MKKSRRTSEQIRRLIGEYSDSGLTQAQFAQRQGVCTGTVQYWLKRYRPNTGLQTPRLIEVTTIDAPTVQTPYRIDLPNGISVSLPVSPEPQYLIELVRQLRIP